MVVLNSVWRDPRVRREAISASQNGIETVVVGLKTHEYNEEKVRQLPFKTILVEVNEDYWRPSRTIINTVRREKAVHQALRKALIQEKPDVIHANDLNALPSAFLAAKTTGSRIVYDSHEIFTENDGYCRDWARKAFWRTLENVLIRRVDAVVSVSHSAAAELAGMYGIKLPTVVTNCAFRVAPQSLLPKARDRFEVLYHGKYSRGRGYEAFVRAAGLIQHKGAIRFVLRGFGEIETELRSIAGETQGGCDVRFDPPTDVSDMVRAASSSHVGVVLTEPINRNFKHTVSNKLFEYISAGLPVILSDVPEHRYLNDRYGFGIVIDAVSPEKIAEAVLALHCQSSLYESLCDNSRRASEVLNWDTEVKKLLDTYRNLGT